LIGPEVAAESQSGRGRAPTSVERAEFPQTIAVLHCLKAMDQTTLVLFLSGQSLNLDLL